jgi:hypothetical protein
MRNSFRRVSDVAVWDAVTKGIFRSQRRCHDARERVQAVGFRVFSLNQAPAGCKLFAGLFRFREPERECLSIYHAGL